MNRSLRLCLVPAAVALGLLAEWAALRPGPLEVATSSSDVRLAAGDFVAGVVLVGCGVVAWGRRPESWVGALLVATGFSWFLATFAGSGWPGFAAFGGLFVTLQRGFLSHALLGYPSGRVTRGIERGLIVSLYLLSAVAVVANTVAGTLATASVVFVMATVRYARSSGPERRARGVAATAATAFSVVLAMVAGVLARGGIDIAVSWAYLIVIALIAVALVIDLVRESWTEATITGLVVDLGSSDGTAPLRDRLAVALGDPSLEIGYRLSERDAYVDDGGRALELPDPRFSRAVTIVREGDEPLAALVHDSAVLDDAELLHSVAAAARIAVANARLQAEVRSQVDEIEASRRRIVEAGGIQRQRLERELRDGAEHRLAEVATLLDEAAQGASGDFALMLAETRAELDGAQADLREFARGIHPRVLTERGLAAALADLAGRAAIPVELTVTEARLPPPIEVAAYFVCSEALANIGKYAEASRAWVDVARRDGVLAVSVGDDGRGGASFGGGSGLRGLADRVEALGGQLGVTSPRGEGTVISADLPLT
jgi:signal transduction histidine kinase